MYLKDNTTFTGAINTNKDGGEVYVEITDGSVWNLTADSYITSLTCDADSINLNGHKLYVDGKEYSAGTKSTGTAVKATTGNGKGNANGNSTPPEAHKRPDKKPDRKPDANKSSGNSDDNK